MLRIIKAALLASTAMALFAISACEDTGGAGGLANPSATGGLASVGTPVSYDTMLGIETNISGKLSTSSSAAPAKAVADPDKATICKNAAGFAVACQPPGGGSSGATSVCTPKVFSSDQITDLAKSAVATAVDPQVVFLGSVIQGGPMARDFQLLPVLPTGGLGECTINFDNSSIAPTTGTCGQTTQNKALQAFYDSNSVGAGTQSLIYTEVNTTEQMNASLGISGSSGFFSGSADVSANKSKGINTVLFQYEKLFFTASIAPPNPVSLLFADGVNATFPADEVGPGNPALYISAIQYGVRIYAAISSTKSASDITASLTANYGGGLGASVNINASGGTSNSDSSLNISYIIIGGDQAAAAGTFAAGVDTIDALRTLIVNTGTFSATNKGAVIGYTIKSVAHNEPVYKQTALPDGFSDCHSSTGAAKYTLTVGAANVWDEIGIWANTTQGYGSGDDARHESWSKYDSNKKLYSKASGGAFTSGSYTTTDGGTTYLRVAAYLDGNGRASTALRMLVTNTTTQRQDYARDANGRIVGFEYDYMGAGDDSNETYLLLTYKFDASTGILTQLSRDNHGKVQYNTINPFSAWGNVNNWSYNSGVNPDTSTVADASWSWGNVTINPNGMLFTNKACTNIFNNCGPADSIGIQICLPVEGYSRATGVCVYANNWVNTTASDCGQYPGYQVAVSKLDGAPVGGKGALCYNPLGLNIVAPKPQQVTPLNKKKQAFGPAFFCAMTDFLSYIFQRLS